MICLADNMSVAAPAKRRRRLGVCHDAGSILPASLRLLRDLARPSGTLQRRNAIRKSSAPADRAPGGGDARCATPARGVSVVTAPGAVIVSSAGGVRLFQNNSKRRVKRRATTPLATLRRGVRVARRRRRWTVERAHGVNRERASLNKGGLSNAGITSDGV